MQAKSFLTAYVLYGVDQNPGFHQISHSLGLQTWDEMSKRKVLRTEEDFLELILNTYEGREPGLKKMFFTPAEARGVGISAIGVFHGMAPMARAIAEAVEKS